MKSHEMAAVLPPPDHAPQQGEDDELTASPSLVPQKEAVRSDFDVSLKALKNNHPFFRFAPFLQNDCGDRACG